MASTSFQDTLSSFLSGTEPSIQTVLREPEVYSDEKDFAQVKTRLQSLLGPTREGKESPLYVS